MGCKNKALIFKNTRVCSLNISFNHLYGSFISVFFQAEIEPTLYHQNQKTKPRIMKILNGGLRTSGKTHLRVFKTLVLSAIALSLVTYAFLRVLFFDFAIPPFEEAINLFKVIFTGALFGAAIYFVFLLAEFTEAMFRSWPKIQPFTKYALPLSIAGLLVFLSSCSESFVVGAKKDFSTGLVADYKNMEPEKVMLVMNDEVLNHTDIPVGEKFILANDFIKGITVEDGKVAVGCSLKITDTSGKIILDEKDLFKDGGVYNEKEAQLLKCTVSTGAPMQAEEYYDVAVKFWDKKGNGFINNKVRVHMIDMP
jgi:hypothetical protein